MELKITKHNNLDSLEFKILEELPKLREFLSSRTDEEIESKKVLLRKTLSKLNKISYVDEVFEVVYKIDDGFICMDEDRYFLIKNYPNMKIGDMYLCKNGGYGSNYFIVKVAEEIIDDKKREDFFNKMDKWVKEQGDNCGYINRRYDRHLISIGNISGEEINFEIIEDKFEEHKLKVIEQEKRYKEKRKNEEEEKELMESKVKVDYDSDGKGKFSRFSIDGKVIKSNYNLSSEYILDKNVNKTFSYEEINNFNIQYWGNSSVSHLEIFLNDKKINYTKKAGEEELYRVTYDDKRCKINEVKIPSSKIKFVFNKIHNRRATKEEVNILIKLNGMKADFIGLEKIGLRELDEEIPIISRVIDDKTFEVEFLGKKKIFDWDIIKYWFFYDGGSRTISKYFNSNEILKFSEEMGANKKDLFVTLKRIKMLNSLDSKDEN